MQSLTRNLRPPPASWVHLLALCLISSCHVCSRLLAGCGASWTRGGLGAAWSSFGADLAPGRLHIMGPLGPFGSYSTPNRFIWAPLAPEVWPSSLCAWLSSSYGASSEYGASRSVAARVRLRRARAATPAGAILVASAIAAAGPDRKAAATIAAAAAGCSDGHLGPDSSDDRTQGQTLRLPGQTLKGHGAHVEPAGG